MNLQTQSLTSGAGRHTALRKCLRMNKFYNVSLILRATSERRNHNIMKLDYITEAESREAVLAEAEADHNDEWTIEDYRITELTMEEVFF